MHELFRLKEFLRYQWIAKTKYYLHSPFVFQFYQNVLEGGFPKELASLEELRARLAASSDTIDIQDLGTGITGTKSISELEGKVAVKKKYGLLLYRLVHHFKPKTILELGTSIGISSAYMSIANPNSRMTTLEGSSVLSEKAKVNHGQLGIHNIEYITGNFNHTLPVFLSRQEKLGMVFFDGNHKRSATISYFEQCLPKANEETIFIFDDIYYSPEMKSAWEEIKKHPDIRLTSDVFHFGICFFRKEKLTKENFVLRY